MAMRALPRRLRRSLATPGPAGRAGPRATTRDHRRADLRWIHIDEPRLADRLWLAERSQFHPLDLEDVASINQRPKVDDYPDYLFLVMQFPRFDKESGHGSMRRSSTSSSAPTTSSRCPRSRSLPLPTLFERVRDPPGGS